MFTIGSIVKRSYVTTKRPLLTSNTPPLTPITVKHISQVLYQYHQENKAIVVFVVGATLSFGAYGLYWSRQHLLGEIGNQLTSMQVNMDKQLGSLQVNMDKQLGSMKIDVHHLGTQLEAHRLNEDTMVKKLAFMESKLDHTSKEHGIALKEVKSMLKELVEEPK